MDDNDDKQGGLLKTIDFEISKIDNEVSKAGWNFWILLASLASLSWILLEELEKSSQEWKYSFLVFLVCSLTFEILESIRTLLLPSTIKQFSDRFFTASRIFGSSRILYSFTLFRNILLIAIILFTKDLIYLYQILLIFYILHTLTIFFILAASYWDLPVRPAKKEWRLRFISILMMVSNSMIIGYLLSRIVNGEIVIDISEYKIGLVVFGIVFLISQILIINQNVYQKETLSNIRRDLLLGNMKFDEAKRQTEILLLGMQASDFLQSDINELLGIIQQLDNRLSEVNEGYLELVESIKAKDIASLTGDEILAFLNLTQEKLDDADGKFDSAEKLLNDLNTKLEKFNRRFLLIEDISSQDKVLTALLENLKRASDSNIERADGIKQHQSYLNSLKEPIEKRVNALRGNS